MRTREDQISELVETFTAAGCRRDAAQEILSEAIFEAERRAEQRAREEMGKDSDRLDWISSTLIEMKLLVAASVTGRRRFVTNVMLSGPLRASDFRMSIDAAREAGE